MGFFNRGMYFQYILANEKKLISQGKTEEAFQMNNQALSELTGVIILVYHEIGYQKNPYVSSPDKFKRQIEIILQEKIPFITYNDLKKGHAAYDKMSVLLTFDDARKGVDTYASDILKYYDIPSMMFIAPAFQNNKQAVSNKNDLFSDFMTWDDIQKFCANNKVEIGAHTYTHPSMDKLERNKIIEEIDTCNEDIKKYLDVNCEDFAYPYGKYNKEAVEEVSKAYKTVSTINTGLNNKDTPLLHLKRTVVLNLFSDDNFKEVINPKSLRNKFIEMQNIIQGKKVG